MQRICLIHGNKAEAEQRAETLRTEGYEVDYEPVTPKLIKELKNHPPEVIVIDLTRLPMQGRDVAITLRHSKSTRNVPIIFVEGDNRKLLSIKRLLPDATYTDYSTLRTTIKEVIANPPSVTVVPTSVFEPYKHTPLTKKLGIKQNTRIALIDPPEDFMETLGELLEGTTITRTITNSSDMAIWFARTSNDLQARISEIVSQLAPTAKLWIAWQKKHGTKTTGDLAEDIVRKKGLAIGWVDYKICAIDRMWSALLFSKRKKHVNAGKPA